MLRSLNRRTDRGAMAVQMALAGIAFLAFAALAFDYGVKLISRTQAQRSADAGALAGAVSLMLDGSDPTDNGPAKKSAKAYAGSNAQNVNFVWQQSPVVEAMVMPPDANSTGADCTANSPCVRVNVYRSSLANNNTDPAPANNPLPTFFARFVSVTEQGVKATATAQVRSGNSANCMLPFGVADRWADFRDPNVDTSIFTDDGRGVGSADLMEGIAGWTPNDTYEPGQDVYRSPVTYPNPNQHTGWTVQRDFGRQLIMKFGGTGTYSSGWANKVDLVGSTGGSDYENDIINCNRSPISIAADGETCSGYPNNTTTAQGGLHGCISASTGVTQGPTKHGIDIVIGRDSGAHWDSSAQIVPGMTGGIVNASGNDMGSPRIRPLAVFDVNHYVTQGCSGTGCIVKVANIIGFFLEGMCTDVRAAGQLQPGNACSPNPEGKREVVGRIVTLPSDFLSGVGDVSSDAAFLKTVVLVR